MSSYEILERVKSIDGKLDAYIKDGERLTRDLQQKSERVTTLESQLQTCTRDLQAANLEVGTLKAEITSLSSVKIEKEELEADKKDFTKTKTDFQTLHFQKGYLAAVTEFFTKAKG